MDKLIKIYALAFVGVIASTCMVLMIDATSYAIYNSFDAVQRSTATWLSIAFWLFFLSGVGSVCYLEIKKDNDHV